MSAFSRVGAPLRRALLAAVQALRTRDRSERVSLALTLALLLLGVYLRTRGYLWDVIAVDVDEGGWARMLVSRPIAELSTRPVLFMVVTRFLVQVFGAWETMLRFLPWSLGIVALFGSPFLAARLVQSTAARLLFVAIISVHPGAIDLAKEFKPYSVSLAAHALLVWGALSYGATLRLRTLLLALGWAPLAIWFAQDVAMIYPGLFLALLWDARRASIRHVLLVCAGGVLTVVTLGLLYVFVWSQIELGRSGGEATFWGRKYGTFHIPEEGGQSYAGWLLDRLFEMSAFPGLRNRLWEMRLLPEGAFDKLRLADEWLWAGLAALGVVAIVARRSLRLGLLLVLPLVTLCLLNWLGFWPLGAFRTNLFLLVYTAALATLAVDELGRRVRGTAWTLAPVLVIVLLPLVAFEKSWHANKRIFSESSAFPSALRRLLRSQGAEFAGPPETVILDNRTCGSWKFYTNLHPGVRRWLPSDLDNRLSPKCMNRLTSQAIRERVRDEDRRVWLILNMGRSIRLFSDGAPRGLEVTERIEVKLGDELTELVVAVRPR